MLHRESSTERDLSHRHGGVTVTCYTVFDKFFPICGMPDYTEGMYLGDSTLPLDEAQWNQIRYVLDEVQCQRGTRLLDVGCGNGRLVKEAARRGATAVGVTISPEQVTLCRQNGCDARLLNYRDLDDDWIHRFDAVVANGPIEHFVMPQQAADGQDDAIYREMFEIFHRVIDPTSANRRFINTTIHFVRRPDPLALMQRPGKFPRGTDPFHFAMLAHGFGGWYPVEGQLERCARGLFELTKTVDGTQDYHWTSEAWLARIRRALRCSEAFGIAARSLPVLLRHPVQFADMVRCMLIAESWNWQFRGPDPPTRLLRQSWRYLPA